jgi:hypothetical protein
MELGIKETKEMIVFAARFAGGLDKSLADGKIDFFDVGHVLDPLLAAGAAFQGADGIPNELLDTTEEEDAELLAILVEELDLINDTTEGKIEEGAALLVEAKQVAIKLVNFVRSVRAARAAV